MMLFVFGGHPNWSYQDGSLGIVASSFEDAKKVLEEEQYYQSICYPDGLYTLCNIYLTKTPSISNKYYTNYFSNEWVLQDIFYLHLDPHQRGIAFMSFHDG